MKYSCAPENIRESSKSYGQRKMNKKLKVTMKYIENVNCKYPDTKIYIEGEDLTMEEVIYFVFEFFERIDVPFFMH